MPTKILNWQNKQSEGGMQVPHFEAAAGLWLKWHDLADSLEQEPVVCLP